MSQKHRIGIVGCGAVADFGHLPAILRIPELEIVALYDPLPHRAQDYATKFGAKLGTTDIDEFYKAGLDGVCIASPLATHHENVLRAAKEGVHVLCEKPIAETAQDAQEMIAAMRSAEKGFFIGFVYRFSSVAQQLKKWYGEKLIGDVQSIRMIYNWHLHGQWVQDEFGTWIESPTWRGRMLEGGPMIDCGVHMIDLIRWITGQEVVSSFGHGAWVSTYDAPDHVYAHMNLSNGAHAMVEMSFSYGHTVRHPHPTFIYEMIGSGGVIKFDRNGYLLEARTGQDTITIHGASEKNFDGMWAQFSHFLSTGEKGDLASPDSAIVATEIATSVTAQAMDARVKPVTAPERAKEKASPSV